MNSISHAAKQHRAALSFICQPRLESRRQSIGPISFWPAALIRRAKTSMTIKGFRQRKQGGGDGDIWCPAITFSSVIGSVDLSCYIELSADSPNLIRLHDITQILDEMCMQRVYVCLIVLIIYTIYIPCVCLKKTQRCFFSTSCMRIWRIKLCTLKCA